MKFPRLLRPVLREAQRQGWEISHTRSGHFKLRAPDGTPIFTAGSPSDQRALQNMTARMRRHGFTQ